MIDFDAITETVYVGTYPQRPADIDQLCGSARATAVLNLQSDADMRALRVPWAALESHYARRGVALRRHAILDFDAADLVRRLRAAVAQAGELEADGHRLYIHCTAGVGRAPAVAIGHLAWNHGWNLDRAYAFVRGRRDCDPYLDAIRQAGEADL